MITTDQDLIETNPSAKRNGKTREISSQSLVIHSITGINRRIINYIILKN